ncbi:MAG TPA: MFS transporter [Acetobacteraceae bacterium]
MDQQVAGAAGREGAGVVARRLRSIFSGSVGNLIEWYDFYIYNSFSIYFASQFSSSTDPTVQFLNIYGIYAIAFLIRPVGGILLGYYADMRGRRAALTLSVMLMCAASLMIAVIPTYGQIGIAAPILLLVARLIQGLSLGGEYAASATYLSEISLSRRRGFYTSFQYVTLIGGQVLASLLLIVMQQRLTSAQLVSWGWRVPFVIGALLAVYGLYLRRNMLETEDFARASRSRRESPLREVFRHPRELFLVFGLTMGGTAAFYTFSTYMPTFLVNTVKLSREDATLVSFGTLFFFAALQPVLGALSDHIGRKPVLLWFGLMGTLCTYFIMTAMAATRDVLTVTLLLMTALGIVSGYTSINAVVKAELFPAGVRALGVGLPYAVAASVFGGSAPYVALWFKDQGHESWFFIYITALIFGSLLVYATMRETKAASLIAEPGAPLPASPRAEVPGAGMPGAGLRATAMPARRRGRPLVWITMLGAAGVVIATLLFSQRFWSNTAEPAKEPPPATPRSEASAAPAAPLPSSLPPAPSAATPGAAAVSSKPDAAALPPVAPALTGDGTARSGVPAGSMGSGAAVTPQAGPAAAPPASASAPIAGPDTLAREPAGTGVTASPTQTAAKVESAPATPSATAEAAHAPAAVAAPSMVELPGGSFRMGSSDDPAERPAHSVTVAPFLLATHAATVREWQQCVDANACPAVSKGKPDEPVTNVSWDDAKGYAAWLSGATKQPYRLPTEAEWEYAARAGTETRYAWGNAVVPGKVSCKGCAGPVSVQYPPRVDAYPPNAFGLLGMGGGVAEWVSDCWHRTYQGAPRNGSGWDVPNCRERVLRGGSWMEDASAIRPASRQSYNATIRYPTHGIRLARSR